MTDNPSDQAERRAIRRRWINVGEIAAVAGLIIAALSLYFGWSERRDDESQRRADKIAAQRSAAEQRSHVGLVATDADGDVLTFKGVACTLQSADISFPTALGVPPQNTVLEHRIEAAWFREPLLDAVKAANIDQGRLPVLVESRCTDEDGERLERAIYDVPYRIESRLLQGKIIRLRGLVLREHVEAGQARARLDTAWRAVAPAARPKE